MTRTPRDILALRALRLAHDPWERPVVKGQCFACGREGVVEGSPYCRGCDEESRKAAGAK